MEAEGLTGRGRYVREMYEALERAAGGVAQTIILSGPAGIGKSMLLNYAECSVPESALVLRASGHPAELDMPYAGLHQLLTPVGDALDALPEPHRGQLRRALAYEIGGPGDPLGVANAMLTLVTQLAEARLVVVIVDNVQWLDQSSRQALVFLVRRLDADAICVLLASRSEDDVHFAGAGRTLAVDPLDDGAARELLREEHAEMSAIVTERVIEQAGGLPLALAEIPAELTPGQRRGVEPLPTRLPQGRSIERLYRIRLDELDDRGRRALLLASFDGLDAERLSEVLQHRSLSLADLAAAERSRLVAVVDGVCVFAHPTVRSAIQHAATAGELEDAHAALAEIFRDQPARYAHHLQGCPRADNDEVVGAIVAAAEQAMGQGGFAEAAVGWEAAVRYAVSDDARRDYRAAAITCFLRSGAGPQAKLHLTQMIDSARSDAEAAQGWSLWTVVTMWVDGTPPSNREDLIALGTSLVRGADPAAVASGANLLTSLAVCAQTWGNYREAKAIADVVAVVPEDALTIEQRLVLDVTDVMTCTEGAGAVLRSSWVEDFDWSRIADLSVPVGIFGVVLGWMDDIDACQRVADRCREVAQNQGGVLAARIGVGPLSAIRLQALGKWSHVVLEYASSERLALDSDFTAPYPFIALRHAYVLAAQGRADECQELRSRAAEVAPTGMPAYEHLDGCVVGLLHVSLGEYSAAAEVLAAAGEIERMMGTVISGYTSRFPDEFEATWYLGLADSLVDKLDEYAAAAERMAHPTMQALAARCRALLVEADDLDEAFGVAMDLHDHSPQVFEAARTRLLWGQRLRRARRKSDARIQLRAAEKIFDRLAAVAWLEKTRSELAACGERRADQVRDTGGLMAQLTPREFEVSREVAGGASNSQAAERLFVSQRTVEYHLSRVYRKLDVANRAQLAELFEV